ncbi:DUF1428 domain-containing protein [Pseudomonas sp. ZM23]|uniref:DUF1428 domain-containing protein n=1 Tax=Pseudomonas triclosanedens TaxID=2961893 RepID=A0ABY7A7N4_9PSED|nr:DUF1428 domain-containing protein [Pseudomonas triclosanedens]MCP8466437.1 DUF1428 domain-containing protein [Pseudomonas triclosanedens]MCP8473161.1 DUF1428 domain-containing protein [Pseudomonas triclosanedens]MCP8479038.1 DUF1428 domain-containing protein [Pseudomonas triclosanedens]WAI52150.1 DUF1428 domain-containing protein [Pseudomonas triclosanedens]
MTYVDGFLVPVPEARREQYLELARKAAQVFRSHGALSVVECWGDDVPDGKVTSFPLAVQLKEGEAVVFSWITWASKEARDAGMKASMEDPRMKPDFENMPFDGQRMIFGGFRVLVDA